MLTLSVLLFIQFFVCLIFFLYFRHKLQQQLKLQDFKKEIDEVIVLFNRQAERHISYLETLLEHPALKDSDQNPLSPPSVPKPSSSDAVSAPLPPSPVLPEVSDSSPGLPPEWYGWQKSLLGLGDGDNPPPPVPLAREKIKAFHAHLGGDGTPDDVPKKTTSPASSGNRSQAPDPVALSAPALSALSVKRKSDNRSQEQTLVDKTVELYRQGYKHARIAKELRISTAEVKLILELKEQLVLSKE